MVLLTASNELLVGVGVGVGVLLLVSRLALVSSSYSDRWAYSGVTL